MNRVLLTILPALFLGACASQPAPVTRPGQQQEAAFEKLKSLEGSWQGKDDQGQQRVLAVFAVSSNQSIVREIMFPGMPHEMTNVYHLDGPSIVVTHYCAMGNQPRMRATGEEHGAITFRCDGVTNLTNPGQMYMGELTVAFKDKDHVTETWHHTQGGKRSDEPTIIELTRTN
jgi:hypothetical protein